MSVKGKYIAGRDIILQKISKLASRWPFITGIALLVTMLFLVFNEPCPSHVQQVFYRMVLGAGLALCVTSVSDIFILKHRILKIGSGLIMFVLALFVNPSEINGTSDCKTRGRIDGQVFLGQSPLRGAEIRIPVLSESDLTNPSGKFSLDYDPDELKGSVDLHVKYHSSDTSFQVSNLNKPIIIRLKDTIAQLDDHRLGILLKDYLDQRQNEVEAESQQLLLKHQGRHASLDEICTPYRYHEQQCKSHRNEVSFKNGFDQLSTQKAFRAAHILLDPMVPYHAHYLENYKVLLYELDSLVDADKKLFSIHYGFLNLNPLSYTVDRLKPLSKSSFLLWVSFEENIRLVRTRLNCEYKTKRKILISKTGPPGSIRSKIPHSKSLNGTKKQTLHYEGMRPVEIFKVQFQRGQWRITGTHASGK